jgi:phosphopantetheinyl transferase
MSRPQVVWLDAREEGLSADELRERARSLPLTAGAVHVSRSYCYPFALVAGYGQRVGVDVERVAACDGAFAASIQTPAERVAARDAPLDDHGLTSLWSSKEALAKALGDALDYDPRRLDGPAAWPQDRAGPWRAARLDAPVGHVAWLCWRGEVPAPTT